MAFDEPDNGGNGGTCVSRLSQNQRLALSEEVFADFEKLVHRMAGLGICCVCTLETLLRGAIYEVRQASNLKKEDATAIAVAAVAVAFQAPLPEDHPSKN